MKLPDPLYKGILIRRYKRFLADVLLETGETVTAHCPNSGSMKGCYETGQPVLLSRAANPKRKLPFTWELSRMGGHWIGINTARPNLLVREAIENKIVRELQGYDLIRPEVPYGENSRIDLLLEGSAGRCYVEVKNVTLTDGNCARFPDSVTVRGQKHLRELQKMKAEGHRAVIFFVIQRPDADTFAPADAIDPEYGKLLRQAVAAGVEALAYQARISPVEINITHQLPILLNSPVRKENEKK
ncbi:MAG: DNA/RNA nuclease SfsA [Calditrichia bacterium]